MLLFFTKTSTNKNVPLLHMIRMSRYCIHANNFFRTCHFKSAAYILLIRSSLYSISLTINSNNSMYIRWRRGSSWFRRNFSQFGQRACRQSSSWRCYRATKLQALAKICLAKSRHRIIKPTGRCF